MDVLTYGLLKKKIDAGSSAAEAAAEAAAASAQSAKNYADNIADPVSGIVADWLDDNIDPSTGYAVDSSLSVAGAAADAAAVGNLKTFSIGSNLLSGVGETSGAYINASGVITTNSNSAYTDIISVEPGKTYELLFITSTGGSGIRIHAYIDGVWASQILSKTVPAGVNRLPFTVPSGANGVRISYAIRSRHDVFGLIAAKGKAGFYGTSLMYGQNSAVGDTATQTVYTIPAMYAKASGMVCDNKGVKGQGLIKDWATIYGSASKSSGYSFDGYDLVVANWMSNDLDAWNDLPLGNPADETTETLLGHYNLLAQKWTTHYPQTLFMFVSSTGLWNVSDVNKKGYKQNYSGGGTPFIFNDLVDGVKAVMAQYGIPFIDMRENNPFCINNYGSLLTSDNVHPNDLGYKKFSAIVTGEISARYVPSTV